VIAICLLVTPVPLIVIVAVRWEVVVLAVAVKFSVPPADPVSVLYVSHAASVGDLLTVTATLAVTATDCVDPACGKESEVVLTLSAAVTPGCVIDICLLVTPDPLIVIVAVRDEVVVLAVAVTLSVPPADPDRVLYVSHAASVGDLLTVTATLAVTVTGCVDPACGNDKAVVLTLSARATPGCVMDICLLVTPVPLIVIVAVRAVVVVLAAAVTLSVPPADPDSVLYVNHVAVVGSFVTVTATLAVTVTGCVDPACGNDKEVVLTVRDGVTPGCVMLICLLVTPVPLMVIVAVRDEVVVLAAALTFIVALEVPDAGVSVSHEASAGFLAAVHATFEVTVTGCVEPACGKLSEDVLTASEGVIPGCVMLICLLVTPVPLMVIVAVRDEVVVLAVAVTLIVALEVPDAGVSVSHEASAGFLSAVHATLAVTVTGCVDPACGKVRAVVLTVSVAGLSSTIEPKFFHILASR
jgi:hypothetical protein